MGHYSNLATKHYETTEEEEYLINNNMHKYNFENSTEKRQADREYGYVLMPDPDGQDKHLNIYGNTIIYKHYRDMHLMAM